MYVPKQFRGDAQDGLRCIRNYPFGTLLSGSVKEGLLTTHVPLLVSEGGGELLGHVAKQNPHVSAISAGDRAIAMFMGPHGYVSPTWYDHLNVPTWNYVAVKVVGVLRLIEDQSEVDEVLRAVVRKFEDSERYDYDRLPVAMVESQRRHIVCFSLSIDSMDVATKLSQNRGERDYLNVIRELEQRATGLDSDLANAMLELRKDADTNGR